MGFPKGFVWGAAAASYQVEGAANEDGKGTSVWDVFCRQDGKVWNGNTGDEACDHYHRWKEDVGIMREIGIKAYRLSISWPRVMPGGTGKVNAKGLDFYDRLVDALVDNGIEPWVTLFHWDYPYALYLRGGWLNRESSEWFAEYTKAVVDRLSDRVTHWMTLNEPQCFIGMGHYDGTNAPGMKLGRRDVLLASHNTLLAHGKAVKMLRSRAKAKPTVGAAMVGTVRIPATPDKRDIEAARKAMFAVNKERFWGNAWFSDPIIRGKYPAEGMKMFENDLNRIIQKGDMKTIAQPLDLYCVNIYSGQRVRATGTGDGGSGYETVPLPDGPALTTMGWHVCPESLYWGPKFFHERYKLPIAITENGMANPDWVSADGKVHDPQRIDYLSRYLSQYRKAIDDGVPCVGYFLWSIMDNFEWAEGYKQRFGIVHVDYKNKKRTLKDSAYWYGDVIKSNGKKIAEKLQ